MPYRRTAAAVYRRISRLPRAMPISERCALPTALTKCITAASLAWSSLATVVPRPPDEYPPFGRSGRKAPAIEFVARLAKNRAADSGGRVADRGYREPTLRRSSDTLTAGTDVRFVLWESVTGRVGSVSAA